MKSQPNIKSRKKPRISVNKLGEMADAKAARQITIIKGQKHPSPVIITWYKPSLAPVTRFFADPNHSVSRLNKYIAKLRATIPSTKHQRSVRKANLSALGTFVSGISHLPLKGNTFRKARQQGAMLKIASVDVSVRPELEVIATSNRVKAKYGMLKLYFSQGHPLTETSGEYIATLVHQYAEQHFNDPKSVSYKNCYVYDVFAQRLFTAPQSYVLRRKDIHANCQFIAAMWPNL